MVVMVKAKYYDHGKLGKGKVSVVDTGVAQRNAVGFEWGLYFWRKPDGHLFKNENGDPLNIPSIKGDVSQMVKLRTAAAHYGQPEGEPWFYAGIGRATDEEHAEQVDRLNSGLIPSLNDIGAIAAAKKSLEIYGDAD